MLIEDSLKNTAVSLADLCDAVKDKLSEEVTNLTERSKELENERAKFEAEKGCFGRVAEEKRNAPWEWKFLFVARHQWVEHRIDENDLKVIELVVSMQVVHECSD